MIALPIAHAAYLQALDAHARAYAPVARDEIQGKPVTTRDRQEHEAAKRSLDLARAAYLELVDELAGQGASAGEVEVAA